MRLVLGLTLASLLTFGCSSSDGGSGPGGSPEPVLTLSGKTEPEMCDYYATRYPVGNEVPSTGGDTASCTPGSITPEGIEQFRQRIGFYRELYGLPALGAPDPSLAGAAQECAMMMGAAQKLSHNPGTDWQCYTESGATGASESNIGYGSGSPAQNVDGYMFDFGNEDDPGHRRWLLYPRYTGLAFGWFDGGPGSEFGNYRASCVTVFHGPGTVGEEAEARTEKPIAYPPAGAFPVVMATVTAFAEPFRVPWTLSWQDADFTQATLEMTDALGAPIPLAMPFVPLDDTHGATAVTWLPEPLAKLGDHWKVRIEGVSLDGAAQLPIVYEVEFVDCGAAPLY